MVGFIDDDAKKPGTFMAVHAFQTSVAPGGSFVRPTVRVRVGQSPKESVLGYRIDNRIDAFQPLREKLGSLFDTVAESPLVLASCDFFQKPLRSAIADLTKVPSPAIFHLVSITTGGFDHSYPDFLPPDPRWGSTADLRVLAEVLCARGLILMPYTNGTWWNPDSSTLNDLPAPSTLAYSAGWLELVRQHAERLLMTEDGWDRLAEWMVGFCGSPLTGATSFGPEAPRYGAHGQRVAGP
jgi:hypothetical protein